ncbi:MAG: SDR family oxidoreductase [Actinobacteria bacterium]|nr:SDR family oxidoreductase [Actinomycetota bacterium]
MSSDRFGGKTALVTGAGGEIGAQSALRMAREGASLVLFDRKEELLDGTRAACEEAGAAVWTFGVDQTDRARVDEAVAAAWEGAGRIDALFANAGYGQFAPFLEISERAWHRHVDVNLSGTFHVCQATARQMAGDEGGGAIVVSESSGAIVHSDQLLAYCTTKAALKMMVTGMAAELGTHRIRVNGIMPGVVETAMTGIALGNPEHRDVLLSETPVGRLGKPDDVAALVCFLCSSEAAFINGESISIDGGQTVHGHPRWFRLDYRDAHEERWEIPR